MDVETSCEAPAGAAPGQPAGAERRRYARLPLTLHGRYMLSDGSEFPCQTLDVSPIGIGIRGAPAGAIGERIVAYFDGLGRVEGRIVRRAQTWFAVDITATPRKLETLTKTIRSLAARQAGTTSSANDGRAYSAAQKSTSASVNHGGSRGIDHSRKEAAASRRHDDRPPAVARSNGLSSCFPGDDHNLADEQMVQAAESQHIGEP